MREYRQTVLYQAWRIHSWRDLQIPCEDYDHECSKRYGQYFKGNFLFNRCVPIANPETKEENKEVTKSQPWCKNTHLFLDTIINAYLERLDAFSEANPGPWDAKAIKEFDLKGNFMFLSIAPRFSTELDGKVLWHYPDFYIHFSFSNPRAILEEFKKLGTVNWDGEYKIGPKELEVVFKYLPALVLLEELIVNWRGKAPPK